MPTTMPTTCSLWSPTEVLKIDPDAPRFTCVGYAPSKGRRCHNPIAAANRQEASELLTRMSRIDPSSSRLDSKLEALAPRLLCRRWHQNQAESITEKWNDRIERFVAAKVAREEVIENTSLATSIADARRTLRALSNAIESSRVTLARDIMQAPSRRRIPTASRIETSSSAPRAESSDHHSTVLLSESQREAAAEQGQERQRQQILVPSTEQPHAVPVSPVTSQEIPENHVQQEEILEASQPVEESETASIQSAPTQEPSAAEEHHIWSRRRIERDCSICCEDLSNGESLVWCKTQCGQNYHRECINTWLETNEHTKTCPYW